ncbi:MAG: DUF1206 domain-containing protein [Actinobacteria bacterium]|nr:DUF1206 domain-containing protein [Actinomycetota bacterium]
MAVADAKQAGKSPWFERAGRLGLVAKAAIYGLIAALALAVPLGLGGKTTDRGGALQTVAQQPFGKGLLVLLGIGFACYALWRFAQAFLDREDEGSGLKAVGKRAGYVGRGAIYALAGFAAFAIVAGSGSGNDNEQKETAKVLDLPLGRWIVGAVGLGFLAAGLFNVYRSATKKFRDELHEYQIDSDVRPWAIRVGVFGFAARGVVFGLIGVFLVRAAIQYDPKEAIGVDGALRKLAQQAYGNWLLGLVAAGLLAYAAYCLVEARYREV